jgi:LacI family transcriptional regulator
MKRVRIKDVAELTGLSRATIDRALNNRGKVHRRTAQLVESAVRTLASQSYRPTRGTDVELPGAMQDTESDLVLRLGRGMLEQIKEERSRRGFPFKLHDMYQVSDDDLFELVRNLCRNVTRPLVLTAKSTEPLCAELRAARLRGKRIVAFVSDLAPDARDSFVGIDNRMAGQSAAYIIGHAVRRPEGQVGIVLGNYAFSCHEDREIGFRSNLRANFPHLEVADVAKGDDSPEQTFDAVSILLRSHSHVDAIYNVGGGNQGLADAVRNGGRSRDLIVVTHEVNHVTTPLARDGAIHFLLAQDPAALLSRVYDLLGQQKPVSNQQVHHVDFGVYTRFNLPSWCRPLVSYSNQSSGE